MTMTLQFRCAVDADSPAVTALVTGILVEYGLKPDLDGIDRDLLHISESWQGKGGVFDVLEDTASGRIVGTVGLIPTAPKVVELRKMYLAADQRGKGLGRRLLQHALDTARKSGYRRMELETAGVLKEAIALYERSGFVREARQTTVCRCELVYAMDL